MAGPPGGDGNQLHQSRLYIEPIIAWRCWQVQEDRRRGVLLRSITYKIRWPARKPMRAHCLTQLNGGSVAVAHPSAPHIKHGCGIYSVRNPLQARKWATYWMIGEDVVTCIGEVKLWGQVHEFTEGYLAEFAYPVSLKLIEGERTELVDAAIERYGLAA